MKTKIEFKNQLWLQLKRLGVICACLLLLSVLPNQSPAAPGDVDPSFDPGSTINGEIMAMAVQSDGRIIIGGDFTTLHDAVCSRIARLNADGTADHSFLGRVAIENGGYVQAIALQADGKIVIGGWFNQVNGSGRTNLARLNPDGSLDSTFLNGLDGVAGVVGHVASQADGKILIAGWFSSVNGAARTNFVRLNSDGSLDETFDVVLGNQQGHPDPLPGRVGALAVQADGKILIGGSFPSINGVARTNLARLNPDGTVDASFAPDLEWQDEGENFPGDAQCFLVQGDHRIVVGGWFNSVNGLARTNIVRLNPDGSVDPSFDCPLGTTEGATEEMQLRDDGRIAAIGSFTPDGIKWMSVVLLETNGTLVPQFQNPQIDGQVSVVGLNAGGKILLGVTVHSIGNPTRTSLARLNDDGSLDNSFDSGKPTGPNGELDCLALEGDSRILIGGRYLSAVNGQSRGGVARLNADGSLDDAFAPSVRSSDPGSSGLFCLAVQPDGKILLGGWFNSVNGATRNGVARIHADGTLDHTFLEGLSGVEGGMYGSAGVYAVAIQTNGQILIGGNFTKVNGQSRIGLARLNSDGTLDAGFNGLGSAVTALAIQPDGKVLVAWGAGLVRCNPDGTSDGPILWSSDDIWCLVVQEDGKIVVGGRFDSLGGQPRLGLARVNPDLTVDNTFLGVVSGDYVDIRRLAREADGKLLIAGNFTAVNGVARANLARLLPDGSLDTSFVADLPPYAVSAIVIQPDTRILLGGSFTAVNQTPRGYVARLMGSFVAPVIQTPPQSQTSESRGTTCFNVEADGYPEVAYQWYFNGTNLLAGGTNRTLCLNDVQFAQAGGYTVVISNAGGAVTSAPVSLSVIAAVERRPVPAISPTGEAGSTLNLDYTERMTAAPNWLPLAIVQLASPPQFNFDLSTPLPPRRFYRAWQTGTPAVLPSLNLNFVPAITLTGDVSSKVRVDGINQFGPTDAWFTLDTVTLTNTSQLYFDVSVIGQPQRLYRLVPLP